MKQEKPTTRKPAAPVEDEPEPTGRITDWELCSFDDGGSGVADIHMTEAEFEALKAYLEVLRAMNALTVRLDAALEAAVKA
ncbi:MAG: hypothetical protein IT158_24045 [Bryobacterales bacterium]|nr:hypothetical protein [Bryobacterales bacterium]